MLPDVALTVLWLGVTLYAIFGGADFGAGFWDLVAGGAERGRRTRARIEHSIGPVWEANHVWLIFSLVVVWTAFPPVFAAVASTLYIPFTIAAIGVIARGSAFVFRKETEDLRVERLFGAAFATSSVLTPFAFGTIAGAIASFRVPPGIARGDVWGAWLNPTSMLGGVVAVLVAAYLAAVYLTADARRDGEHDLAEQFRRRAIATGVLLGAVGIAGGFVLHSDAPKLFAGLTGRAAPVLVLSAVFGGVSLLLLKRGAFLLVRGTAALAVVLGVWSWGVAQYPTLLQPDVTPTSAAAPSEVLVAVIVGLGIGAVLIVPSLALLFSLFQRPGQSAD